MTRQFTKSVLRASGAGALAAVLLGAAAPATGAPAGATVNVVVADDVERQFVADIDSPTRLTVSGSGFQSIQNGFGGIYVLFGTTDGTDAWAPSAGGTSGTSYRYVADDASNPVGFQLFIPFPGSSTEAEGNGGTLNPDGTWSAQMTVPGAQIDATDAAGNALSLDCTVEQCGVITIGAHGVVNATNETFTPIEFVDFDAEEATPTPSAVAEEAEDTASDETTADAEEAASEEGASPLPWIVAGAAVVMVAAVVVSVIVVRRRTASTDASSTDAS